MSRKITKMLTIFAGQGYHKSRIRRWKIGVGMCGLTDSLALTIIALLERSRIGQSGHSGGCDGN